MSASSAPAPDDPFLAAIEGDPNPSTAWKPIIDVMRDTNHRKWGFLVYRVYYGDDAAWERFMDILRRDTENSLLGFGKQYMVPFLDWTEMQDRAAFDGASKDDIREHFRTWIRDRSVERDGFGVEGTDILRLSARYKACLYVDKEAMESAAMTEYPMATKPTGVHYIVKGKVVLVGSQLQDEWIPPHPEATQEELDEIEEEEWAEEEYPPIDGDTSWDVGWMYVELRFVASAYEMLSENLSEDSWRERWFYKRPPAVFPGR
ncbi:hypothetical protein QBC39DRAFT_367235 [Podospora conica]|nr:hypothetical protein QBC39DRAFT_367235 [Schizothecium conicum]